MRRAIGGALLLLLCACPSTNGSGGGAGGGAGVGGGSGGGSAGGAGGGGAADGGLGLQPCLEKPTDLPRPQSALPCDLLPPGFKP